MATWPRCNISSWDTSKVTDMSKLFLDAHTFNEPYQIGMYLMLYTMHAMFDNAYVFNQPLNLFFSCRPAYQVVKSQYW